MKVEDIFCKEEKFYPALLTSLWVILNGLLYMTVDSGFILGYFLSWKKLCNKIVVIICMTIGFCFDFYENINRNNQDNIKLFC